MRDTVLCTNYTGATINRQIYRHPFIKMSPNKSHVFLVATLRADCSTPSVWRPNVLMGVLPFVNSAAFIKTDPNIVRPLQRCEWGNEFIYNCAFCTMIKYRNRLVKPARYTFYALLLTRTEQKVSAARPFRLVRDPFVNVHDKLSCFESELQCPHDKTRKLAGGYFSPRQSSPTLLCISHLAWIAHYQSTISHFISSQFHPVQLEGPHRRSFFILLIHHCAERRSGRSAPDTENHGEKWGGKNLFCPFLSIHLFSEFWQAFLMDF